jgi:hypothetical protein
MITIKYFCIFCFSLWLLIFGLLFPGNAIGGMRWAYQTLTIPDAIGFSIILTLTLGIPCFLILCAAALAAPRVKKVIRMIIADHRKAAKYWNDFSSPHE